ncbi:Putative peptidoglycan binding domain protein [Streptomyces sp. YIM 121038]|uniref:peptidoglycan-binding protein n=1 Tax=Streptomyces sp. YIM 121038 TaxID=2136401 RepID=UPI001110071A|nr:peptidoglycan-binding protein [Streptomyces sp. YIM 121038]QCX76804.1 Putative peptidoglycan binding domain protein [Streptomyces sp. YIM 121038]
MEAAPAFEEFRPASDCGCPGCVYWRRAGMHALPPGRGGHPGAHGARRALVLAAAAGSVLGPGQAPPAAAAPVRDSFPQVEAGVAAPKGDDPGTPQGRQSPLHGTSAHGARLRTTTRAEIIGRAGQWVNARVPYNLRSFWADGYRQDCSGFVSMAWDLGGNEWTGTLDQYGTRISKAALAPGDILLFHNPANPERGSHVTIFGGWTDSTRTSYLAYEQARPYTRKKATPYAYWKDANRYRAYRYKGLRAPGPAGAAPVVSTRYPGARSFGPGARNAYVTRLGRLLVARGGAPFYRSGPGPRWGDADRRATRAFQLAQGWTGRDADGIPGPLTWSYLVTGKGRDIPGGRGTGSGQGVPGAPGVPAAPAVPVFPGKAHFRPGQSNAYVELLGRQLVRKGFGKHYAVGPGPRWGEADRRAVEAFQRAQGWRGGAADGIPGPETWRRLFR